MITTMYIGSGDVSALLAAKDSKAHVSLMQRFVSGVKPRYNALASPIDALRTGAILEDGYHQTLPMDYYPQHVVVSEEMNVLRSSLDFAKLYKGKVVDFEELKTKSFNDFVNQVEPLRGADEAEYLPFIKKSHKEYYHQIQQQLYCAGLDEATLVFLAVYSYDDEENVGRNIQPNEVVKFRIRRDEQVIAGIKERAAIFQQIKDYYTCSTT